MPQESSTAVCISEEYNARSRDLAKKLSLPVCDDNKKGATAEPCNAFSFVLQYTTGATPDSPILTLRDTQGELGGSMYVDFIGGKSGHRRRFGGGRGQPLARAIGLKGGANPVVVDATAGLGRDAFVLASLGARVTMIERSPILAALLEDAMSRGLADSETAPIISERMTLIHANAIDWLQEFTIKQKPDVIYMDPMYPHRNKSALVKKEMRYLRELVGDDEDASQLLHTALSCASNRVVVKRPRIAPLVTGPILKNRKPSTAIESKNTRYDIYLV